MCEETLLFLENVERHTNLSILLQEEFESKNILVWGILKLVVYQQRTATLISRIRNEPGSVLLVLRRPDCESETTPPAWNDKLKERENTKTLVWGNLFMQMSMCTCG